MFYKKLGARFTVVWKNIHMARSIMPEKESVVVKGVRKGKSKSTPSIGYLSSRNTVLHHQNCQQLLQQNTSQKVPFFIHFINNKIKLEIMKEFIILLISMDGAFIALFQL